MPPGLHRGTKRQTNGKNRATAVPVSRNTDCRLDAAQKRDAMVVRRVTYLGFVKEQNLQNVCELVSEKLQFLVSDWQAIKSAFNISETVVKLCDPVLETGYVRLDRFGVCGQVRDLRVHGFQTVVCTPWQCPSDYLLRRQWSLNH
ncbi:hypothetical protein NDU88_000943 [Pleurodeles waltl]|uniref:Uncharacterized protein n=1 Tax=Pleurodeles waltl TaxID=8319 RepID=A0AAV7V9I5_PLEWA|nr:hypothetical protein NDU88_000943 [Pleurodeles waltl]